MRSKAFFLRPPPVTISIPSLSSCQSYSASMTCRHNPIGTTTNHSVPSSVLFSTVSDTSSNNRLPLWIDTDVGFDDLVAIGCCYGDAVSSPLVDNGDDNGNNNSDANKGTTTQAVVSSRLVGISTVGGGLTSDPSNGVAILRGLLQHTNTVPIVSGKGQRTKAAKEQQGNNPFPQTQTKDKNKNSNGCCNHNDDPSWLTRCRKQMNEFCEFEGIFLLSSKDNHGNADDHHHHSPRSTNGDHCSGEHIDDQATATIRSKSIEPGSNKSSHDNANGTHERTTMDLVCLGPLTNLAHWLEEIPDFATNHLNSVWILGGNLPIRRLPSKSKSNGNEFRNIDARIDGEDVNEYETETDAVVEAEFNFARDPEAVRTVFHHSGLQGTTIYVVPQEVCDRSAFERSFFRPEERTKKDDNDEECHEPMPSAANVIEDWLQSSPSQELGLQLPQVAPITAGGVDTNTDTNTTADTDGATTVVSLLPAWMVRLIRKRTFSVYGDPICIYVRDHARNSNSDRDSSSSSVVKPKSSKRSSPRILWKNYCTSDKSGSSINNEILTVDSDGRLILQVLDDANEKTKPKTFPPTTGLSSKLLSPSLSLQNGDSTIHPDDNESPSGINVRIAHEVELGPVYMDWLTESLLHFARRQN